MRRMVRTVRAIRRRMDMTPSYFTYRWRPQLSNTGGDQYFAFCPFGSNLLPISGTIGNANRNQRNAGIRKDNTIRAMTSWARWHFHFIGSSIVTMRMIWYRDFSENPFAYNTPGNTQAQYLLDLTGGDTNPMLALRNLEYTSQYRVISDKTFTMKATPVMPQNQFTVPATNSGTQSSYLHLGGDPGWLHYEKYMKRRYKWKGVVKYTVNAEDEPVNDTGHYFCLIILQAPEALEEFSVLEADFHICYSDM